MKKILILPGMIFLFFLIILFNCQQAGSGGGSGGGGGNDDNPHIPKVIKVAAGDLHTVALFDNGTVKCWGHNNYGQLGYSDTFDRGDGPGEMGGSLPTVSLGTGRTAVQLTAGGFHTLALLDNGTIKCWGYNSAGQLGYGDTFTRGDESGEMGDSLSAVDINVTGWNISKIIAGGFHSIVLYHVGSIKCWGSNGSGQLGYGNTNNLGDHPGEMGSSLSLVQLSTTATAVQIAAGRDHSVVLLNNGTIKCWGSNNYGQLGYGDTFDRGDGPGEMSDSLPAVTLGTGRTAVQIAAGYYHTVALLDNGTVKCWGNNSSGQLGYGNTDNQGDDPGEMDSLPVVNLGTGRTAVQIAAGAFHTIALLDDGTVKCWGYNSSGQLGYGNTDNQGDGPGEMGILSAVNLGTGSTAIQIAAKGNHTVVLLDNGTVKCWGSNNYGQLGYGDMNNRGDNSGEMGDNLLPVSLW